jgi:hypothetical protein
MVTPTTEIAPPTARAFAEFFVNHSWYDVGTHISQLTGVTYIGFTDDANCLKFKYGGYEFCVHDAGRKFNVKVHAATCPESVLQEVHRHFAALLAPEMFD